MNFLQEEVREILLFGSEYSRIKRKIRKEILMENQIPDFLVQMIKNDYGERIGNEVIEGYHKRRNVTLRVNTLKANRMEIEEVLLEHRISYKQVPWFQEAFILDLTEEGKIKELEIYEEGKIYLQSLSSMLPAIVLEPKKEENILDMTAAPGGKTTQIAAMTKDEAYLTACEKNPIRLKRLQYNLEKQGVKKVTLLSQDARKLDESFSFDKILLDAPCSGSGTLFVEDPCIGKKITQELIERSAKTQLALLKKAVTLLKSGHEMVYATCSILKQENEENIKQILADRQMEILPISEELKNLIPTLPVGIKETLCVMPNQLYEGFFIAKLKKK